MAPVTITRTFLVPGSTTVDGLLGADLSSRRSAVFSGAGYDWSIHYYAGNLFDPNVDSIDMCLQLDSKDAMATVAFELRLLDPTGSLPPWKVTQEAPPLQLCSHSKSRDYRVQLDLVVSRALLELAPDPRYLTRGGLLFECTITVFTEEAPPAAPMAPTVDLSCTKTPASNMMEQLGGIYATGDGADVTYSVQGEIFRAHKIILAMRSPVFKAQLYGGMMESTAELIEVEDMLPDVFRALLRYIYTDALPDMDGGGQADEDDDAATATEVISHLLVAADRYGVERLRILCEHKLCDVVDADSLVKMLVFAEEQHCGMLRDACIEFMATSDRMGKVVTTKEYAELRRTHPLVLIDALEKSNRFRRESVLNLSFGGMNI